MLGGQTKAGNSNEIKRRGLLVGNLSIKKGRARFKKKGGGEGERREEKKKIEGTL